MSLFYSLPRPFRMSSDLISSFALLLFLTHFPSCAVRYQNCVYFVMSFILFLSHWARIGRQNNKVFGISCSRITKVSTFILGWTENCFLEPYDPYALSWGAIFRGECYYNCYVFIFLNVPPTLYSNTPLKCILFHCCKWCFSRTKVLSYLIGFLIKTPWSAQQKLAECLNRLLYHQCFLFAKP